MHWLLHGADEGRASDSLYGREQTSHAASLNGTIHDVLNGVADHDWYQISLTTGQTIDLGIEAASFDPLLQIFDSHGVLLSQTEGGNAGSNASTTFTPSAAGIYYIGVSSFDAHQGDYNFIVHDHSLF